MKTIPFEEIGKFSKIILDYINSPEKLSEFTFGAASMSNFKEKIVKRSFSIEKRELLVKQLASQYTQANLQVPSNVSLLLNENTYTITTGHQLCLLGGPQYFIHKIVSTIKLSQQLKMVFPESNFIPVFWLASEDHDFEEINNVNLFGKKLKTNQEYSGPVGRLDASIFSSVIDDLNEILGTGENDTVIRELFLNAYSAGNLATATRIWVNELFNDLGIVIIDGDDVELKKSFIPILKDEIINRKSAETIQNSSESLKKLGYSTQVTPREINLFYIENNLRERIVFEKGVYLVLNTAISFTESEILENLTTNPEKFSPNVILRPVYEEEILPNIAYVGGPGEIAYWLQLKSNFDRLNVEFPLLVLRDSFIFPNVKLLKAFNDLGFELNTVFEDESDLIKTFLKSNSDNEINFEKEEAILQELKNELLNKVNNIDNSLSGMINAEMSKINKLFEKLESRIIKSQKSREEVSINKIRKFKNTLLPNGVLIERFESFIPVYLKIGKNYLSILIENSDVFNAKLKVITEE